MLDPADRRGPGACFDPESTTRRRSRTPRPTDEGFDAVRDNKAQPLLTRATQGRYVPGSVFKIVTAVAGLGSGRVGPDTTFENQAQAEKDGLVVNGFRIREHAGVPARTLDLVGATEVSSNIWFALAGLQTGGDKLAEYAAKMGFGSSIPFDLPTAPSQVTNGDGGGPGGFADDTELANASYGQAETFVTPLQMALVAATVANDGELMRPHLVTAMTGEQGTRTIEPQSMNRVISPADANAITAAMVQAVEGKVGQPVHDRREGPGRHDGRQVRHGRAGRLRRAALVVHRLRTGRESAGRDRGSRRARRPGRGAGCAAGWIADDDVLQTVRRMSGFRDEPDGAGEPIAQPHDAPERAVELPDVETDAEREQRPVLERLGLAGIAVVMAILFGFVGVAAIIGGEYVLGAMGLVGCMMTLVVGGITLLRG